MGIVYGFTGRRSFRSQPEIEPKRLGARRNKQTYRYDGKCRRFSENAALGRNMPFMDIR